MLHTTRKAIVAALLGITAGCGGTSPVAPAGVTPAPVPSAPVAPVGAYTLTPSASEVARGAQLSVSWTATTAGTRDTVALYKKGDPNTAAVWWRETFGAVAGTFTLTAPSQEGQYEFRYLLDDEVTDTARSSVVTVTSQ